LEREKERERERERALLYKLSDKLPLILPELLMAERVMEALGDG
jgi:hypothetical protein